ncbi:MAG: SDR family oxidoreductase [Pseudomonadota bacterium]
MQERGWDTVLTTRRSKERQAFRNHRLVHFDFPKSTGGIKNVENVDGLVFCLGSTMISEKGSGLSGVSLENFVHTLSVSCFAFIQIVREMSQREDRPNSVVALSFLGGERVVPGYEMMGVAKAALEQSVRTLAYELGPIGMRVNAVSAGAVSTPSARVLPNFRQVQAAIASRTFIRRNVVADDVANAVAFLLSEESAGMSGEIMQVNGGLRHSLNLIH